MDEVPALEDTVINQRNLSVSIKALRPKTVTVIARLLDPPKYIRTDEGLVRF